MKQKMLHTLLLLLPGFVMATSVTRTIPNALSLDWPHELVYMDLPAGAVKEPIAVEIEGVEGLRPGQLDLSGEAGPKTDRVWFIATVRGSIDEKGRRGKSPKAVQVTFHSQTPAPSGIAVEPKGDFLLVDNGTYEFRLRTYGKLKQPVRLDELKHWIGGMRVKGTDVWDAKAFFEGNSLVKEVKTKILQRGPVFWDLHLVYVFEDAEGEGTTQSVPLAMGKQTFKWEPNRPPREELPKLNRHYEVMLRFVADDDWLEVNERYRLPRDKAIGDWGVHQYYVHWGAVRDTFPAKMIDIPVDQHLEIDTAFWERWFLYDQFGGNDSVKFVPARPRPDQKGRPFAQLRPRWHQGGGGAQDFFLTAGGAPPAGEFAELKKLEYELSNLRKMAEKNEKEARKLDAETAKPDMLASERKEKLALKGKLRHEARQATEKVEAATAFVKQAKTEDGETGRTALRKRAAAALELTLPGSADYDPTTPAVGVVAAYASKWVGPYPATIACYVRENSRSSRFPLIDGEPSRGAGEWFGNRSYALFAGQRQKLHNVTSIVRRHTDWTLVAQINKYILEWERDPSVAGANILVSRKEVMKLREDLAKGRKTPATELVRTFQKEYDAALARREAGAEDKAIDKLLKSHDAKILKLLLGEEVDRGKPPTASLYLGRRYQNDALNPTNFGNRRMVNGPFPEHDLFSIGKPFGGADQAAIGYIYTDLDAWPGWHYGWSPGNPNFHTDKYIASVFSAAAMQDHPHAKEWMAFGLSCFTDDLGRVLTKPHGVGYECPGYSGFSMSLQLETARVFLNSGMGNPVADNPLFKGNARWHRKLITPHDRRLGFRHEAPHGDTHRWTSGLSDGFAKLAVFYRDADPTFASELVGAYEMLPKGRHSGLLDTIIQQDPTIEGLSPEKMDWSSEFFYGFGPIMRTGFGTDQETFLSMKAGPAHGHYHNDEMAFHYYGDGTPISLDYNCSYHPRADHASLHNTVTFGREGKVRNNKSGQMVGAAEEVGGTANVAAFVSTDTADVCVAERSFDSLGMRPIDPDNSEFARNYHSENGRKVDRITHRRTITLVKHPPKSPLTDYLVVREETISKEPQHVNLHLLARDVTLDGGTIVADGQWDKDVLVAVTESTGLSVDVRGYQYADEWLLPPVEYAINPGESWEAYDRRMAKLAKGAGATLPQPDWKPSRPTGKGEAGDNHHHWKELLKATNGKAMVPPRNWNSTWVYGEHQVWLRMTTEPGTPVTYVVYPYKRGGEKPTITTLDGGVRVALDEHVDVVTFTPDGAIAVTRDRSTETLVEPGQLPALGTVPSGIPAVLQ